MKGINVIEDTVDFIDFSFHKIAKEKDLNKEQIAELNWLASERKYLTLYRLKLKNRK